PCVAKGLQSSPDNLAGVLRFWGRYAPLSRRKAAPTKTASELEERALLKTVRSLTPVSVTATHLEKLDAETKKPRRR
ncbi:hypothetical protein, partial [Pseudomonas sp. S37]|uniref:hypothetical protein n=1 Tax=Pseudomonas sp. S37 TaxID=2767449 RepID=UPI001F36D5BD